MAASAVPGALSVNSSVMQETGSFGNVRVDFTRMSVLRNGREIQLTATEFKLLAYLLQNPERIITRKELLEMVWGYEADPKTRTVDIHISKLRQKVETDPTHPMHLRTVHWSGYKFIP